MATEKILITHSFEVGQSSHLVQMFRIAVAKGIYVPNINFVRIGTRELLRRILMDVEAIIEKKRY